MNGVFDWLNENEFRAFPLKESISRAETTLLGYRLTDDVVLDAQLVYSTHPGAVSLDAIEVSGDSVTFELGTKSFIADKAISFPQYIRNLDGSLLVVGEGILSIDDGRHEFNNVIFESGVIYEFGGDWFGVSNIDVEGDSTLIGDISLKEGYQVDIKIDGSNVLFDANRAVGVPVSCGSFGGYPADCDNIISFINGAGPDGNNKLLIQAGNGIVVLDDAPNHRIYIGLSFNEGDVCRDIVVNPEQ